MKRYNWIAACLLIAIVVVALTCPVWILEQQEAKALSQTRIGTSDMVEFAFQEETTLLRRLQIRVDESSLGTWLAQEMMEDRYGTTEEQSQWCVSGLQALLPELNISEDLFFPDISIDYYYDSRTQEKAVFLQAFQELHTMSVNVDLDVLTGKVVSVTAWLLDAANDQKEEALILEPDAVFTLVETPEKWAQRFGDYLGLELVPDRSFQDFAAGGLWYCYTAPDAPAQEIWYCLYYDETFVSWQPSPVG